MLNLIIILLYTTLGFSQTDKIKVMFIDTGYDANHKYLQMISGDKNDTNGHGSHIAGLLVYDFNEKTRSINLKAPLCDKIQIISCKFYDKSYTYAKIEEELFRCLNKAKTENFNYVNISAGGYSFSLKEYTILKEMSNIRIVTASGNNNKDIDKYPYFPAGYNSIAIKNFELPRLDNVIPVGNLGLNNKKYYSSNYGSSVIWEKGTEVVSTYKNNQFARLTGTSQASPIYLHKLLKKHCNGD